VVNDTPRRFTPLKETQFPLYKRLYGSQGPVGTCAENIFSNGNAVPGLFSP
jgi:hypothetical protein